jgi:hypothetical protein
MAIVAAVLSILSTTVADHHVLLTRGFKHTREFDGARRQQVAAGVLDSTPAPTSLVMIASPTTPTSTIVNLSVTWSGVPDPESTDWIAIYCTDASISDWHEWDYVNASEGWRTGAGRLSFVQARSNCALEFRMYRDPSPYAFLGKSNAISWPGAGTAQPYQQRVAYGYHPQSMMTVGWTSMNQSQDALVMVGLASGTRTHTRMHARTHTYSHTRTHSHAHALTYIHTHMHMHAHTHRSIQRRHLPFRPRGYLLCRGQLHRACDYDRRRVCAFRVMSFASPGVTSFAVRVCACVRACVRARARVCECVCVCV